MHIIDIYRAFHPSTSDSAFFPSVHGTFSRIDHVVGQKTSLNKVKKIEIMPSIFSDHNAKWHSMNTQLTAGTNGYNFPSILCKIISSDYKIYSKLQSKVN